MKAKTIQQEILAKVNEFALSIDDAQLQEDVIKKSVVTGGCIASMFLQEKVNDYDMYFTDNNVVFRLAVYYIKKMQETTDYPMCIRLTFNSGESASEALNHPLFKLRIDDASVALRKDESETDDEESFDSVFWDNKLLVSAHGQFLDNKDELNQIMCNVERVEIYVASSGLAEDLQDTDQHPDAGDSEGKEKYRPVFLSSNAITLSDKIQLVLRFTGKPEEIHESYDFVHATNYWTDKEGLVTNSEALESLLARELIYRGSLYPLASIFRTRKFIQRDWSCHVGNYVKMAMQLNEFDLSNVRVLEEQLTGVDALYLGQVIATVKNKLKDNPSFEFNAMYVCELCDRMMGLRREIDAQESSEE